VITSFENSFWFDIASFLTSDPGPRRGLPLESALLRAQPALDCGSGAAALARSAVPNDVERGAEGQGGSCATALQGADLRSALGQGKPCP
jgi:hypothetical protein